MERVAVIGGGYAGAAFAIHLSRVSESPLEVVVVEPREQVGGGLAHSATDVDHRLNASDVIHLLYPDDELHFRRWLEATGRLARDPDALYADQRVYPRRGDFGAYVSAEFAAHAEANPSASRLTHRCDAATGIERSDDGFRIQLAGGDVIAARRCVLAFGQAPAPIRFRGIDPEMAGPRWIDDPFAVDAFAAVDREAAVLVLGTGLTSADAVASFVGQGHRGSITCLSRHGLRPQDQNLATSTQSLWEQLDCECPPFVERHGLPDRISTLMRIVRDDARSRLSRGEPWHPAIDAVRDAAGEIWRALPRSEKLRFLRHVRPYYDSHRFRITPQTRDILQRAEARGQLRFRAGRVLDAEMVPQGIRVRVRPRGASDERSDVYGALVSCAGFRSAIADSPNPFVRACLSTGLARVSDMGRGLEIDGRCRVISASGTTTPGLYALGAVALDYCGETPAAIFILRQILRMLPAFVASSA